MKIEIEQEMRKGEDSFRQFKERFSSIDHLAAEIAAFANSGGGNIIVGVSDDGTLIGIETQTLRQLNQWISNATTQKIEPPLFVETQTIEIRGRLVLVITVPRGDYKPYSVNKGDFWVKNGADKRRATREELYRLMQSSGLSHADEMSLQESLEDFDYLTFTESYRDMFGSELEELQLSKERLLENLKLAVGGKLTLAGLLLYGKNVQARKPQFSIKATYYISEDAFRDKEDIGGKLIELLRRGVDFVLRNLHRVPRNGDFNDPGELEIPEPAIREAIANALVHRDYFVSAPVMIDLCGDRLEIVSPGVLPNTLTVENIKLGIHLERNPIILSFMAKMPGTGYTGRGSGIPRMLRLCKEKGVTVAFDNDTQRNQFRVIFSRTRHNQKSTAARKNLPS